MSYRTLQGTVFTNVQSSDRRPQCRHDARPERVTRTLLGVIFNILFWRSAINYDFNGYVRDGFNVSSTHALKRADVSALSLNGFFTYIYIYIHTSAFTYIILNTHQIHLKLLHATHKRAYLYICTRGRVHNGERLEFQPSPIFPEIVRKCVHTLSYLHSTIGIVFVRVKYIKIGGNQTNQISRCYLSFVNNVVVIITLENIKTLLKSSVCVCSYTK
jgi:hypothetical protein